MNVFDPVPSVIGPSGLNVTAFHPSWYSARDPSISKCCVVRRPAASAPSAANRYAKLVPSIGALLLTADPIGRFHADQVEHRRHHVDRVRELVPQPTGVAGEARRPAHDARIGDAALVHLALPPLERCVAGHRPAPRIVVVQRGTAELVDALAHLRPAGGIAVDHAHVVDRAGDTTFRAGAVVGHEHDHGVVGVAARLEVREETADLVVGVGEEAGEALHEARRDLLVGRFELVPRRHPRRARRQLGVGGDDAELHLADQDPLARRVPPVVEHTPIPLDPLRRRMVRRVARPGGEVEEERLLAVGVAQVAEVLDRVVDEVFGEVVALGRRARWLHRVVVAVQRGHELVRLAAVEAVPAVEAAPERPAAAVGGHVGLVVGRQVPLPHRVRRVAVGAEDLGEEPVLRRHHAPVAREAHGEVGDAAHAVGVVVAAGEQAAARRRAERGGVEVGQAHALPGEARRCSACR